MHELIITNGDSAAAALRAAGIGDAILPWQDILFEGPVPATASLMELTRIRAAYLANAYAEPGRDPRAELEARDAKLARHDEFEKVTLWFEHDLSDQLQLIQILDFFAHAGRPPGTLFLVQADRFLTEMPAARLQRMGKDVKPLRTPRLRQAVEAWAALCQASPMNWSGLLFRERLELRHLWRSVLEMLGELPRIGTGLTWSEEAALRLVDLGTGRAGELFAAFTASQRPAFMGDWSFYRMIDRLAHGSSPLLAGLDRGPFRPAMPLKERQDYFQSELSLTPLGDAILAGREDYARHAQIDRWWGGTHLTNNNLWRWDVKNCRLIAP
jgi:hypothetical protein